MRYNKVKCTSNRIILNRDDLKSGLEGESPLKNWEYIINQIGNIKNVEEKERETKIYLCQECSSIMKWHHMLLQILAKAN